MINLKGRFIETNSDQETTMLLQIAEEQGFKWNDGAHPTGRLDMFRSYRLFRFSDDMKIFYCINRTACTYESFSKLEKTEKSITEKDFDDGVKKFISRNLDSDPIVMLSAMIILREICDILFHDSGN